MADERVRLVQEVDNSQAKRAFSETERAHSKATSKMDAASKRSGAEMLKIGEDASKVAGLTTAGFSAIAAGITAANANAENLSSSLVGIGASLTGAFIAGGPIGLGVGALAVGIGFLAGRTDEAAEAAKRARAEYGEWLQKTRTDAIAVAKALGQLDAVRRAEAVGSLQAAREIEDKEIEERETRARNLIEAARDRLTALDAQLEEARNQPDIPLVSRLQPLFGGATPEKQAAERAGRLKDIADGEKLILDIQRQQAEVARFREQVDLQRALISTIEADRAQRARDEREELLRLQIQGVEIYQNERSVIEEIRRLKEEIRILEADPRADERRKIPALQDELAHLQRVLELTRQLNAVDHDRATQVGAGIARFDTARTVDPLLASLRQTLGRGLSDIIYDGITNGFERSSDLARSIMEQLLKSLINQIVNSGISALMNGLFSGTGGGGGGILGIVGALTGGGGGGGGGIYNPLGLAAGFLGTATGSPDGIAAAVPALVGGGCGPGG